LDRPSGLQVSYSWLASLLDDELDVDAEACSREPVLRLLAIAVTLPEFLSEADRWIGAACRLYPAFKLKEKIGMAKVVANILYWLDIGALNGLFEQELFVNILMDVWNIDETDVILSIMSGLHRAVTHPQASVSADQKQAMLEAVQRIRMNADGVDPYVCETALVLETALG
jgi:hypothetical protein